MKKVATMMLAIFLASCQPNEQIDEQTSSDSESASEITNNVEASSEEESEEAVIISFVGVGDNLIHDSIIADVYQEDGSYNFTPIYEHIASEIQDADLAFLNQETILAGTDYPYTGYPAFNTPNEMAGNMADLGFDLVNGATNHTLDYDYPGAIHAIEVWSNYPDLIYTGTYLSEADRLRIPTIERKGVTFSFLSYTYGTNGIEPDTDWRVSYFDEKLIRDDVKRAKEVSDVVIVSAHWGDENTSEINDFQRYYAQLFADLEVDVVVGTHPHILQPIEWLEGEGGNQTLVIYSLGNLLAHSLEDFNTLGGMIHFDFVVEDEQIGIDNVFFEPTVSHYTADHQNIEQTRRGFKIYKLKDYTDEIAGEHGLNGYNGIVISQEHYQDMVDSIIPKEFLK